MLDVDTERDYLRRIQEKNDPRALQALLVSHLRLVMSIAKKYARHGTPVDELVAEGNLGLVEAARRFDTSRNTRFSTYASWWVHALIRRHTLGNRRIVGAPSTRNARRLISGLRRAQRELTQRLGQAPTREQIAEHMHVPPEEVEMVEAALSCRDLSLAADSEGRTFEVVWEGVSPEQETSEREVRARQVASVRRAMRKLDQRERTVVERRLLAEDGETLADIGGALGLSRERVRQIELRACQKLREELHDLVA